MLEQLATSQGADAEVQVALLKKAQDQMKQQGEAMIRIIEQTPAAPDPFRLDVYA